MFIFSTIFYGFNFKDHPATAAINIILIVGYALYVIFIGMIKGADQLKEKGKTGVNFLSTPAFWTRVGIIYGCITTLFYLIGGP